MTKGFAYRTPLPKIKSLLICSQSKEMFWIRHMFSLSSDSLHFTEFRCSQDDVNDVLIWQICSTADSNFNQVKKNNKNS